MAAIRKQALLRSMAFEENLRTHPSAEWSINTGSALNDALEIAQFRMRMKNRTTDGVAENFSILPPIASKPAYAPDQRHMQGKSILAPHLFDRFSPVSDQTALVMRDENVLRLPSSLAFMSHIQTIDLSHNQLKQMSDGLGDLVNLRELDLSSNFLQNLPESVSNCRKLEVIRLQHNNFRRMPILQDLTRLMVLNLSDNHLLEELDPSIATLRSLSDLDVRHAALRVLPDHLGDLRSSLTTLRAGYNFLVELPPRLGRLAALRSLDLRANQLSDLPHCCVERLTALRALDLGDNRLTRLPRALGLCAALESLRVASNQLRALPASAAHLTALTLLDAAGNCLRRLPEPARLTRLGALHVDGNRLRAFPAGLHRLPTLTEITALDNPRLRAPPHGVIFQGTRAILDFLRRHDSSLAALPPLRGDGDRGSSSDSDGKDDGGGRPEDALPGYLEAARLELSEFELGVAAREAEAARELALARRAARIAARAAAAGSVSRGGTSSRNGTPIGSPAPPRVG